MVGLDQSQLAFSISRKRDREIERGSLGYNSCCSQCRGGQIRGAQIMKWLKQEPQTTLFYLAGSILTRLVGPL